MKRMFALLVLAVAAIIAVACAKEKTDEIINGTPITITVGAPGIGTEPEDPNTKISTNGSDLKHKWDAGDEITIFSYTTQATSAETIITNWGPFVTTAGGAYARFRGVIPAGYTAGTHGSKFIAFSQNGADFTMNWASGPKTEVAFNIPGTQDGTGLKYCLFTTKPESGTQASFDGDHTFTGLYFSCAVALSKLNIIGGDVRTIRVTVKHEKQNNYGLVSSGSNKDIKYNVTNGALSGGSVKTIVINNENNVLSGDIFFVTRQTNGNNTNGYATLVFEFINGAGLTCTKTIKLATGINADGTASAYKNLSNYNSLSDFGSLDLTSEAFI